MIPSDSRRQHWAVIVAEQQASGLSAARWCRDNKIETNNFYSWRKRLTGVCGAGSKESTLGQWLTLGSDDSNAPHARHHNCVMGQTRQVVLEQAVVSPSGLTLRVGRVSIDLTPGFDRRLLADVLGIIESSC